MCFTRGRGFNAPRKWAVGSKEAKPQAIANWNILPTPCFARRLMSRAPRASIFRSISRTSGGVISFISLLPRNGNTSRSKRYQTRSACAGANADFRFSCQRSAITRKASPLLGSISDLFFIGSRPSARIALATDRLSRAAVIPTSGYAPNESSFSLRPYRYFRRQSLAPFGCTSRNNPPASASLYACSRGFAFLAWLSVRGMGVSLLADTPEEYPQNTPTPLLAVCGPKRKHADANVGGRLGFLLASIRLPDASGPMRTSMDMKPGSGGGTRTPDTRIMIPLL